MLNFDAMLDDDNDELLLEIEAALQTLPLREAPAEVGIVTLATVARYEMAREEVEQTRFDFWAWLDHTVRVLTQPWVAAIGVLIVASFYFFAFSDPRWQSASNSVERTFTNFTTNLSDQFSHSPSLYLIVGAALLLVASVALTPRVRQVRQLLRETQLKD